MKITLKVKEEGLYCSEGDFFIDAWQPVSRCVITHAHGDHAFAGHGHYLASDDSLELLQYRLGSEIKLQTHPYDAKFKLKDCWVSFHPAGHILGSSQIRIERKDEVAVISGDYKRNLDLTCKPFEVIPCDLFITESTFALPIYLWDSNEVIANRIYDWWKENQSLGLCSVLFCYSLGKAQRILSMLSSLSDRPVFVHGGILSFCEIYKKKGITLAPFLPILENKNSLFSKELVLAPPIAKGSPWMKRFYPYKTALASGWMKVRGMKKQRNVDNGFALSDHADWKDLLRTITETGAKRIGTTHGQTQILARYLNEIGMDAFAVRGMEEIEEESD